MDLDQLASDDVYLVEKGILWLLMCLNYYVI